MEPDFLQGFIRSDPATGQSLVQQVYHGLRAAVLDGRLAAGDTLPSTRRAAATLGLGRNTLLAAYELLAAEGFVTTAPGKRQVVVGMRPHGALRQEMRLSLSVRARDAAAAPGRHGVMAPGSPDPTLFPADLWGRALRRAARHRQDGAGFGVGRLQDYAISPCAKGLVVGFGNMSPHDARAFARTLASLIGAGG